MSDESLPSDLGDTGKELIAKFRAENARLTAQLQKYEGIDPAQYKSLVEQSQILSKENQALSHKVKISDAQFEFFEKAAGKIDPSYVRAAWRLNSDQLKITDTGFLIGDKPIDAAIDSFLAEMPKFAATSEGSDLPRDNAPPKKSSPIISDADFLNNLDAIAAGTVDVI